MLRLFDTKSGRVTDFIPLDKTHVKMYVCGPTIYDHMHIGNARPIVVFDLVYRLLQVFYKKVTYVRNITDVDDKIYRRSSERNCSIRQLTEATEKHFLQDARHLGAAVPTFQPRATEHIAEMISMIQKLLDKKHAYIHQGHCIFSIETWSEYGAFAKKEYTKNIAGKRVTVSDYKRHPFDFVLWKPSRGDEPAWDSPWGKGRPGWHIECSAMATKYLGENFDIHGGGADLIFPHHQNEIAQACCANKDSSFARYWMHNGFVLSAGEKMAKSLGNFYTVRHLLQQFSGLALRLMLLSTHYRKPLNFTENTLKKSEELLTKLHRPLLRHGDIVAKKQVPSDLIEALSMDVNTPLALKILWQYHKHFTAQPSPESKGMYLGALEILGLQPITKGETDTVPPMVASLARERAVAKEHKDWKTADKLREEIKELNYEIVDTRDGYKIYKL